MRGHWSVALLALAAPASATLDEIPDTTYSGLCQMTETCTSEGVCGTTPAVGDLLLVITDSDTFMGQTDANLASVDHYPTLDAALPLPPRDTRRTFLTDLPPDGSARRFAVRIQTQDPQTQAPVLRPQYFVLTCEAP